MGLKVNDVMVAMPSQLALAKAGMLDLGTTADITTNIMSGFGKGASDLGHIGDVLAYASSNANTNIEQMGEAMVYLAPVGQTLGLSLEDVSSAVMAVSDAGIQGARAGAAFSTSLVRLTKPTEEMEKLMKNLGISFVETEGEAKGSLKPISKIVDELNTKMSGYTDAQKASAINTLFGAEATKHWASLLGVGGEKLRENTKALEECDGTAERMAKTMGNNLAGSIKEMKSKLEDFMITVGNALAPTIEKVAEKIGDLTDWFQSLSPATQNSIVKMGLLAVTIPLVTTALGLLTSGFGNVFKAMKFVTSGVGKVTTKIKGTGDATTKLGKIMTKATPLLTNPWTLLAGAVVVGGTAIYGFKKNAEKQLEAIGDKSRDAITGVGDYLEKELPKSLESANEKISAVDFFGDGVKGTLMGNVNELQEVLESGKQNVGGEVGRLVQTISNNLHEVPEEMRQSVADGLAKMISALASEGKLTEDQFKQYIDTLNNHANIKIEVDFDEIARKRNATLIYNQFLDDMKVVGAEIHKTGGDIQETVNGTVDALSKAKDEDIETFRLLSQGIAEHISSLKMSESEQGEILQQMSIALSENFDPQQASILLSELSSAMNLGFEDIKNIQSAFILAYNQNTGSLQTDTARSYADFIAETGYFSQMLAGEFGSLSEANSQFWVDFLSRLSTSKEDTVLKAGELANGFVEEMRRTDDPQIKLNLAKTLTEFLNQLVTSGKLTQDEAGKIAQGINANLGQVEGEVTTTIKANINEFSASEREILHAMGLIDKETAETDVKADIAPAIKKLEEYKKENQSVVKKVEDNVAEIDADNSPALKSIQDVNDKKVSDKYFTIRAKLDNPTGVSISQTTSKKPKLIEEPTTFSNYSDLANDVNNSYEKVRNSLSTLDYGSYLYQRNKSAVGSGVVTVKNGNDSTMISLLQNMVEQMNLMNQRQNTLEAQLYIDGRQLKSHMEVLDKRASRLSGR